MISAAIENNLHFRIMPYIDKPLEKLYYSIGEVAEILGESTSLVRFWANSFPDFIKPSRNKKGNRLFSAQDVSNFKLIYGLVKERGMTLEGAARRMRDNLTGEDRKAEVIARLNAIKNKLMQISQEYKESAEATRREE